LLKTTSSLKVKAQTKLKIFSLFIPAQISFQLRIYNFALTWVEESIDSICIRYVRDWVEAPISSCIKEWLVTPRNKCGMSIPSFRHRTERLQLGKRAALKASKNENIRCLWNDTVTKHISLDCRIISDTSAKAAISMLARDQVKIASDHFLGLSYQGLVPKSVVETVSPKSINQWSKTLDSVPTCIFNFARKALQSQLPTNANLVRWKRAINPNCPLCDKPQTNKHVLSNCSSPIALDRYTKRHNRILEIVLNWIVSNLSSNCTLYADLMHVNVKPVVDIFNSVRPDIAVKIGKHVHILELTIFHETNLVKSKEYKAHKYTDIDNLKCSVISDCSVSIHTLEITVLGFRSDISAFTSACHLPNILEDISKLLTTAALNSSFDIYCSRHNVN
jgi:hypothetical protein